MTWIATVPYEATAGRLRSLYDRVKGPDNTIPKWFLEALGVYTSMRNACAYCVEHHYHGMTRLVDDPARAAELRQALEADSLDGLFTPREIGALRYAGQLTAAPASLQPHDVEALRAVGWDDGEILEINQVVSYFNYANRTVLGLGVTTEGDVLGLSPNDNSDPDNWSHA